MKFREFLERQLEDRAFAALWYETDPSYKAGELLIRLRVRFGLSQAELAEKAGLKRSYIARIESGEANPTVRTLGRILASLGFSLVLDAEPRLPTPSATDDAASGRSDEPSPAPQALYSRPTVSRAIRDAAPPATEQ